MTEPLWLTPEKVIELNYLVVFKTNEPFRLLKRDQLESAIAKPKNHFYYNTVRDVVQLATTLLFGIARNHPFQQGNKRTGFASAVTFLEWNGYGFLPQRDAGFAVLMLSVLERKMTEDVFITYWRGDIVRVEG